MADFSGPVRVSDASRKVMEALAETIIPSQGPERPGAMDVDLVDLLMRWLKQLPGSPSWFFIMLAWMWEFSPIWSGRIARLSKLSPEERTNILEQWEGSRFFVRRWSLLSTKVILMAVFYNNPDIWPKLGYEPGCLSQPPRPIED